MRHPSGNLLANALPTLLADSFVLDLHSRKLVGWAMSEWIDTPLVLQALDMALLQRGRPFCPQSRSV